MSSEKQKEMLTQRLQLRQAFPDLGTGVGEMSQSG